MFRSKTSSILNLLLDLYNLNLTGFGKILFWGAIASMSLGNYTTTIKIYVFFCFIFGLFAVAFIYNLFFRFNFSITGSLPEKTSAGQTISYRIRIRNNSKKTVYFLKISEKSLPKTVKKIKNENSMITVLNPGEESEIVNSLYFKKRGAYLLDGFYLLSCYPFGILNKVKFVKDEKIILVYPEFSNLSNLLIPVTTKYQPGGLSLSSSVGESTEFIGTREYRYPDNPKLIHWRSWARTGSPVVKEFHEEYYLRIALILDTFIVTNKKEKYNDTFEKAVSLSASVADNLAKLEYVLDIFIAGPKFYHLQAGRALAYLENILDLLACIEPSSEKPFEKLPFDLLSHLRSISTCILVMLDLDERREKLIELIKNSGCGLKIIVVKDDLDEKVLEKYENMYGKIRHVTTSEISKGFKTL